jgi:hypothetical protein
MEQKGHSILPAAPKTNGNDKKDPIPPFTKHPMEQEEEE